MMEQGFKIGAWRKMRLRASGWGTRLPVVLLMQNCLAILAGSLFLSGAPRPETLNVNAALSDSSGNALELFEKRYRSSKALSAVFLEQFIDNGKLVRKEAGRAYFLHPGKMRWDYQVPERNLFLVDGKYVWFYSPSDHTVTRMPTKKSEDWRTPLAFLTTDMKLSRVCAEIETESNGSPSVAGDFLFRCTLRGSQEDAKGAVKVKKPTERSPEVHEPPVLFELSPDGELRRVAIAQEGRVQLEFSFKDWQWNPVLPKGWFEFIAPPGVAIVDGQLSDTPGLRQ
jgi:outer membrane lipoprotein carrier protein